MRRLLAGLGLIALGCVSDGPEDLPPGGVLEGSPVVINEVSASGDDELELYNRSGAAVDISGWYITDDAKSVSDAYVFPAGTSLASGAFLALTRGQHHQFGFGKDDAAYLFDPEGRQADVADWGSDGAAVAWCRVPDGSGEFRTCLQQSFGASNPAEVEGQSGVVEPNWIGEAPDIAGLEPDDLGWDAKGNLWVGDKTKLRVVIFDADGKHLGEVGGAGSGLGEFFDDGGSNVGPHAIRATPDNVVYVTDRGGQRLNIYDGDTFTATGVVATPDFRDPKGLEIGTDGTIYVSDQSTDRVYVFDKDGTQTATWEPPALTVIDIDGAPCQVPCAAETLALDEAHDRMFVTSANAGRIEVYQLSTGQHLDQHVLEPQAGNQIQDGRVRDEVEGLAIDVARDLLFAVDEHNGRILVHDLSSPDLTNPDADFAFIGAFGKQGDAPGELSGTDGLHVDPTGQLLAVADQENERVQVFAIAAITAAIGE